MLIGRNILSLYGGSAISLLQNRGECAVSKRAAKPTVVSKKTLETSEVSEEKSNEGMSNTFPIDSVFGNKTEPLARPTVTEGKDYPHLASMIAHTPDVL